MKRICLGRKLYCAGEVHCNDSKWAAGHTTACLKQMFKTNEAQQQLNKILECVQCLPQHSHHYWSAQLNVYSLTIPSHASELSQNTLYFNSTQASKEPVALGR